MQKLKKDGLTDKTATKRTKKASMSNRVQSNRVQRKSVFRKRWGGGGSGVVAPPPFHTKNIRSPTRIFISRSFRSSCNVKRRYRKLATKFSSFTNYISLRTESGSKQRNEALQHFPVMKYSIKTISCTLKNLTFFFLDPIKNLPSVNGRIYHCRQPVMKCFFVLITLRYK